MYSIVKNNTLKLLISLTSNEYEQTFNSQVHSCFYEYLIGSLELLLTYKG